MRKKKIFHSIVFNFVNEDDRDAAMTSILKHSTMTWHGETISANIKASKAINEVIIEKSSPIPTKRIRL